MSGQSHFFESPDDPSVAPVEAILDTTATRLDTAALTRASRPSATHALWIRACVSLEDAPTWLIDDDEVGRVMWCRIPDGAQAEESSTPDSLRAAMPTQGVCWPGSEAKLAIRGWEATVGATNALCRSLGGRYTAGNCDPHIASVFASAGRHCVFPPGAQPMAGVTRQCHRSRTPLGAVPRADPPGPARQPIRGGRHE